MKKICHISDTHSKHRSIDASKLECDIFIHSGDITYRGELEILSDFCDWMKDIPAIHKIVIFGNHELGYSIGPNRKKALQIIKNAATYLENSSVIIDGIKFYGSPATPFFCNWEWNYSRGKEIAKVWNQIPDDTNVLITHGPPHSILDLVENNSHNIGRDLHQGCQDLYNRIMNLKQLKAHCMGHLHWNGGQQQIIDNVIFSNAAICNESYQPINLPQFFEI